MRLCNWKPYARPLSPSRSVPASKRVQFQGRFSFRAALRAIPSGQTCRRGIDGLRLLASRRMRTRMGYRYKRVKLNEASGPRYGHPEDEPCCKGNALEEGLEHGLPIP